MAIPIGTLIDQENFSDAKSFVDALENSPSWVKPGEWSSPWIFRGQRDSSWDLTPSAWRDAESVQSKRLICLRQHYREIFDEKVHSEIEKSPFKNEINIQNVLNSYSQAKAELKLIHEFVFLADEMGFPMPGMENYFSKKDIDYLINLRNYPNINFLPGPDPCMALAQHHGIPTRLLDWTKNSLFAAYFAACDIEFLDDDKKIAVWALRPDLLKNQGSASQYNSSFIRYMDHSVPSSENQYLQSQQGLFICPTYGCAHFIKNGAFPSLEFFSLNIQSDIRQKVILKLALPYAEVGELLRILWLKGISRAHLMPTLDNITQALCSRWRWDS